ncbi:hypothetical protein GCM10023195_38540 [Actinoallomurus liliacearum]|uniref:Uncharacterized protein n=1 Tax=Actinoallomurus liliacearum TaxID=1080073 RepID=A0ABP8TJ28_9ACTN
MIPEHRTIVLRQQTAGLIRQVGLELCDRGGNVLARAAGDERVIVSALDGRPIMALEGRRCPIRVVDPGGGALGMIEQRSRRFATPRLAITGPRGEPVATLSGPFREMRLCDTSGALVADMLMEGGAQVLILREPAEPLNSLVLASAIAANRIFGWSRINKRNRTAAVRWRM